MHDGFLSVAEIIEKEAGLEKLRAALKKYDVIKNFHKIFPDLKKIAAPVKIEKRILYLKVDNATWRSELKFNQATIIEKINTFYKQEIIKTIKFQA
ncbi:MAG: DUF721 domain-containing protein [Ignavibacteriaceae bacterium]|nr:DUF721 domain-containing protein [Ignavibacteriaceae bacterium]